MRGGATVVTIIVGVGLAIGGLALVGGDGSQGTGARAGYSTYFSENYAAPLRAQGASDAHIHIWSDLMAGGVPAADRVAELGDQINREFGVEPRTSGYKRNHSLLSIALVHNNFEGVRALLEAGADPNPAGFFFARAALPTTHPLSGGPQDWRTSEGFLALYLEHGGRIDYAMPDDPFPMIIRAGSTGNYEGVKYLLSNGADPWIEVRGLTPSWPPPGEDRYAFPSLLGGTVENLQMVLWFFDQGYMATAPEPMVALVYDNLLEGIDVITAGQTSLGTDQIGLLRDILMASLTQPRDYRRADRDAAVRDLGAYLDRQDGRP